MIRLTSLAALALCIATAARAQSPELSAVTRYAVEKAPHLVSLQYGIGWLGLVNERQVELVSTMDDVADVGTAEITGTTSPTITYGYRLNPRLSVGAAYSQQEMTLTRLRDIPVRANSRIDVRRHIIGAHALIHYGNSDRIEYYVGARAGVTVWEVSALNFPGRDVAIAEGIGADELTPHFTVIPFGLRAYATKDLSFGAELGFGSPHVIAAQAAYRF